MSYARQMLDAYPVTVTVDADLLAATINAVSDCSPRPAPPTPTLT